MKHLLGYLLVRAVYRYFPPLTLWTGVSLLGLAAVIGGWGFLVRARIRDGEIGVGGGRLHPLAVLVALTAGGVVAGIIGVLLAVPLLAFLDHAVRSLLDSRETPPAQGGAVP